MPTYGALNANAVGTLIKEAVRRAMVAIRAERFTFEARVKGTSSRGHPDLVTTADSAAQRVFIKLLREWFPTCGVVAEEDHLLVPCTDAEHDMWFTVDPLDGTSAFIRRQSHGIGTMIALVCDGEVIAACVGDIMTQEVYTTRPESDDVYRISEFGFAETIAVDRTRPLAEQWILLRDRPSRHSPAIQAMLRGPRALFCAYEIASGSIGINMARLWKGEVGGAVIHAGRATPWDLCPVVGISRKLGFVCVAADLGAPADPGAGGAGAGRAPSFELVELPVARTSIEIERELLVIHESRLPDLEAWLRASPRAAAPPHLHP